MKRPARDSNRRPQRLEARTLTATPPSPLTFTVINVPQIPVFTNSFSGYLGRQHQYTSIFMNFIDKMKTAKFLVSTKRIKG